MRPLRRGRNHYRHPNDLRLCSRLCRSSSYHSSGSLWRDFRNLSDKKCTKKCRTVYPALYSVEVFPQRPFLRGLCSVLFHKSKPADRYLISLCLLILHSGRSLCIFLFHNPSGQLLAVGRNNIITGLHGALSDIIGVIHCGIYDCLSLDIGL